MLDLRILFIASAVLIAHPGCQSILGIDDTRSGDPADAGPGVPGFDFAVLTSSVTLPLDGKTTVDVEITRSGGFAGDVIVQPASLPSGLFAPAVTIPAGQSTAELVVGAQTPLGIGDTLDFDLEATADSLPTRTVSITDAPVTGRPGLLDVTFGAAATGLVRLSIGGDDGSFFGLAVAGDKKIVAVGWQTLGLGARRIRVTRLAPDGTLDPGFNGGDVQGFDFGSGSSGENAQAFAIGHQSDGRMITMGWHSAPGGLQPDIALARLQPDGTVGDIAFGDHDIGKSRLDAGGAEEVADGVVLPDGTILVVGHSDQQLLIARATTVGRFDTTFGSPDGFVRVPSGDEASAASLAIDGQNRILVAGFTRSGGLADMLLARFTPDGQLDSTFGDGGLVVAGEEGLDETAVAVALRPDGRIVMAGTSNKNGDRDFEVRQFLDDGSPDTDFGDSGVVTSPITEMNDDAADMLVLPDGRILVLGNNGSSVLARYTRSGALDPFLNSTGVLPVSVGDFGVVRSLALHDNNLVLISGGDEGASPGPGTFGVVVRMWQ